MKNIFTKSRSSEGFTLVELLIVVTLIAILAIAVLAAIDPIEQINKTRDTARSADGAQIVSSLERYFANREEYPWTTVELAISGTTYLTPNDPIGLLAEMEGVGVCGDGTLSGVADLNSATSGCVADGLLLEAGELKPQFVSRAAFHTNPGLNDQILVINNIDVDTDLDLGPGRGLYACFVPQSKAERSDVAQLFSVIGITAMANGTIDPSFTPSQVAIENPTGCPATSTDIAWDDADTACYKCSPVN